MRLFLIAIILLPSLCIAQIIKGTLKDNDKNPILFSNILIKENSNPSSIVEFTNARNGLFSITLQKNYATILIEITATGYQTESIIIENPVKSKNYTFDFILQKIKVTELQEVIIESEKKPYSIKKDTVTYNIERYKDIGDRKVQDVLKKLPGVEVNEKSGQIKYNGKPIETVTLDGDNLFGYNYSLGTKNINIDMIEQVQAIENYSENPLLKGIEGGEKVSLNLKLKRGKTDYSGNIDIGLGINSDSKLLNNSNANILGVSRNYKSFGILSYNNIGINHSPFDYFSNNQNVEQVKEKDLTTQKVISESLFSNIIDDEKSNINSMLFSNYNSIFKINKRLSVKTNLYYLNDNINFEQISISENSFENQIFTTSDNYNTNKKPQFYRGDIELKYNTSKNSLLEYKAKFNYEQVNTSSSILANSTNSFETSLTSKNTFFNQKLIFTEKLSPNKALQIHLNYAYNEIPQSLLLTQTNIATRNTQNSTFKKNYFDGNFNLLGNYKKSKYSITLGGILETIPYQSNINYSLSSNDNNTVEYSRKYFYNLSSLNYLIKGWSFTPSYSIKILNQNFENSLSKNNILFEPSLSVRYKISNKSFLSSKFSYSQNPFSEEYIFQNPIFINNRLKIFNTPSLEIQKSKIYNINYYSNNLYKQFLLSFGISYQENNGAFFTNYIINNNETIINNFYSNQKSDNLSFNLNTEKFVSLISTTLKLKSSYTKSSYKNIINLSETRNNVNDIITNEFSIKTSFNTKINIENDFIYNYFGNKTDGSNLLENKSIINSSRLKYKHSQTLFSVLSSDYYLPNTNNRSNDYFFLDFSIIYKPTNKQYEFNLMGKNLLNNKKFSQIQVNDFSKSSFQSNLISRYIFINFTYNL